MIQLYNDDCYEKIKDIPDNSVDLVIIDPPYLFASEHGGGAFGSKCSYHREQRLVMNDLIEIAKEFEDFMQARANARRGTEKVYIDPKFATSKEDMEYIPTFRFIEEL